MYFIYNLNGLICKNQEFFKKIIKLRIEKKVRKKKISHKIKPLVFFNKKHFLTPFFLIFFYLFYFPKWFFLNIFFNQVNLFSIFCPHYFYIISIKLYFISILNIYLLFLIIKRLY